MILNIEIINNKSDIEITIENRIRDIKYVYLDTFENHKNYLSKDDNKHSYKFLREDILIEEDNVVSKYRINKSKLNPKKIIGLFILTIMFDDGTIEHRIIYDLNELYCIRVKYLTNCCNNCRDTANYKGLTVLMFREMLLRNTIALNMIEDALKYYKDIYRPFCKGFSTFQQCCMGICKLC